VLVGTPKAVFSSLCIDTSRDAVTAAAFWGPVLGLTVQERGDVVRLGDGVDEHTVWLNPVPEEKRVKNRVHLDVHVAAVDDLLALGARVLDDHQPWTVMTDPEGADFCAFVRDPENLPDYRVYELVVDAADPQRIASWWGSVFGVQAEGDPDAGFWWLTNVPGMPWELIFAPVPEPKTVKNRVHWDVWGTTAELLDVGARLLRPRDSEIGWDVLADPEGNEFCVFARE
jgi:hypothetical protein